MLQEITMATRTLTDVEMDEMTVYHDEAAEAAYSARINRPPYPPREPKHCTEVNTFLRSFRQTKY